MDLLDQESVDQIKSALRDVTDTFFRDLVVLHRTGGGDVPLLAKVEPDETAGDLIPRERGEEIEERYTVSINRQQLAEKGLVEGDDTLLITVDDDLQINGRRFVLVAVADRARFRGEALLVILKAVR